MKTVSVILVCYNQELFVIESIQSVLRQTYPLVQLIVVDDASTDQSRASINYALHDAPGAIFIPLRENTGICAAFNRGLKQASGEFVIDLAGDDVLHPDRVEKQVAFFETLSQDYGVIYHNANYIDSTGRRLGTHFALTASPSQGDVYSRLISTYFVPPPTMMSRKKVMDELRGYDESLAYEDFDFWIRSSRNYKYAYQPDTLTTVRKHPSSFSVKAYSPGDRQLMSTYKVCCKIRELNKGPEDSRALTIRLKYEIRQAVFSANHTEATLFLDLLKEEGADTPLYNLLRVLNSFRPDLKFVLKIYRRWRTLFFPPKSHNK